MTIKELINLLLDCPMDCMIKFSVSVDDDDDDSEITVLSSGDSDIQVSVSDDGWGGYYSNEVIIYITGCYKEIET